MRPIKFRAWDKTEKKMVCEYHYLYMDILDGEIVDHNKDDFRTDLILLQFTGLLDKQGKEIYEGDIVKLIIQHQSIVNNSSLEIEISQVEFSPSYFRLRGSILGAGSLISENIEIIGNIFESPELLKGGR